MGCWISGQEKENVDGRKERREREGDGEGWHNKGQERGLGKGSLVLGDQPA